MSCLAAKILNNILCGVRIYGTGAVAQLVNQLVQAGPIERQPNLNSLDASVFEDLKKWFDTSFNPWFLDLTTEIGGENEASLVSSPEYFQKINQVTTALQVARSYYSKVADEEFMSSLKNVARMKARFCEALAEAIGQAYETVLKQTGLEPEYRLQITEASSYEGSTPEIFKWPGTIEAYHQIIIDVETEGTTQAQQQEKQTQNKTQQYLPWVFTAAFGLIAWSAAAKK